MAKCFIPITQLMFWERTHSHRSGCYIKLTVLGAYPPGKETLK